MAQILPDGWQSLTASGAAQREIDTLHRLAEGLSDAYTVYHAVHWTNLDKGFAIHEHFAFLVVNPAGDLLAIEQRSGFLDETPEGLIKRMGGQRRLLALELGRQRERFLSRLHQRPDCAGVNLETLLYCPDYRVRQPQTAGLMPERLVDAGNRDTLVERIRQILPEEAPPSPRAREVHRFLRDEIHLEADVSALMGRARTLVTRLAGGLGHWARQLEMQPWHLRVVGTAGSGKTQLALSEFRAALAAGQRVLYVCFNRPLADHFRRIVAETQSNTNSNPDSNANANAAPDFDEALPGKGLEAPAGCIGTFHQLCDQRLRVAGHVHDFSQPEAFPRLVNASAALNRSAPGLENWHFDTLIIDEGQDFQADWRDQILSWAKPDARLLWLEDPDQNLYGRALPALPGWVTLHARRNYRCPRPVVAWLDKLHRAIHQAGDDTPSSPDRMGQAIKQDIKPEGRLATRQEKGQEKKQAVGLEAASPFLGETITLLAYDDAESLQQQLKEAIRLAFSAGFRKHDLALVSYHGRENSLLSRLEQLGPNRLSRFSGTYDLLGEPQYSEGDLRLESVYRFKGQSAPAIVFCEIDPETLDAQALRKLFVGSSRAMMKLILVMHRRTLRALETAGLAPET